MATTRLFVEILVIGSIALLWIIAIILAFVAPTVSELTPLVALINPLVPLMVVPFLAFTYGIGWVMSFVSERLFRIGFQKKYRDDLFKKEDLDYYDVKSAVLQNTSEKFLEERQLDRHILRISRCNALNFLILAFSMLPYTLSGNLLSITFIVLSILMTIGSFYQWRARYKSTYDSILSIYREISS